MVKVGGKRNTRKACKKQVNLCKTGGKNLSKSPCHLVLSTRQVLATVLTILLQCFLSAAHLLVPPASFQSLHVSRPSIFSLVVLFSSFRLRVPASFFFPVHLIA